MEMNWTSPFLPHWVHDRVFCTMHSRRKDCTCKNKKTRKNQSTHYKVWSINSIIPSTQLMHQHNYSITFFFPLSFVLWTAFSFLWGNLSDQLEWGCSEQLFSLKYCFPISFTFKKYCVLTCWKRPRPSQLLSESAFVRDDVDVWKEHLPGSLESECLVSLSKSLPLSWKWKC